MKACIIVILFTIVSIGKLLAQSSHVLEHPVTGNVKISMYSGTRVSANKPLIVLLFNSKRTLMKGEGLEVVKVSTIKSVDILNGPVASSQYGSAAQNGVILLTINERREYRRLKKVSRSLNSMPNQ
jgi:hypothetical protein